MNQEVKKILKQVAKEHGVSVNEVQRDIEALLVETRNNPDPSVQAAWAAIPCKGETPTIEEVVAYLAISVKKRMD